MILFGLLDDLLRFSSALYSTMSMWFSVSNCYWVTTHFRAGSRFRPMLSMKQKIKRLEMSKIFKIQKEIWKHFEDPKGILKVDPKEDPKISKKVQKDPKEKIWKEDPKGASKFKPKSSVQRFRCSRTTRWAQPTEHNRQNSLRLWSHRLASHWSVSIHGSGCHCF